MGNLDAIINPIEEAFVDEPTETIEDSGNADVSTPEEVALAKKQGWRDAGNFNGDPNEFVTAHEFLERGKNWATSLTKQVEGLQELTRALVADNARRAAKDKADREAEKAKYEAQIAELRVHKAEAIKNADGATVVKIEERIDELKDASDAITQIPDSTTGGLPSPQNVEVQREIGKWKGQNSWYNTDARATRYANMVGDEYIATHPGAVLSDVLAHVEEETKRVFTQYGRQIPAGPDTGGNDRSGARTMTTRQAPAGAPKWASLDEAAQKLGDEMIDRGVFKNRAEYLEFYSDGDTSTGNVGRVLAKYKKNRKEDNK